MRHLIPSVLSRLAQLGLLASCLLLATACGATQGARSTAPLPSAVYELLPAGEAGTVGVASLSPALSAPEDDPHAPGALDYIATVPENVLWWPWKIVGGTGKGFVDGIAGGFGPDRLPILGLLFSPVNAAVGTATGLVTGTLSAPGLIGPRDNFGKTMSLPMERPTPIWWLPN